MNIGDLVMRVIADLKGFSTSVEKEGAKAGEKGGKAASAGFKKHFAGAKGGVLQGLGIGAGLGAIGLISSAVGKMTDLVGDSIKAFNEDQVSVQKLGTALKAAIPGWDGNTKAIEDTLAARMKLGFSDDEQRESLAKLAAATHDEVKALDLQRTAMDLARFSGISLEQAGMELIKVSAGQFRALKKLGIQLPKNAKAEDALAAIQKVVTGGAEDYAKTNEGKVLVSQVKVNEAMEKLGGVIAPLAAEGMVAVADASVTVIDALVGVLDAVKEADDLVKSLSGTTDEAAESMDFLGSKTTPLGGLLHSVADALSGVFEETVGGGNKAEQAMDDFLSSVDRASDPTGTIAKGFIDMGEDAEEGTAKVVTSFQDMVDDLNEDARSLIDGFFNPIHTEEQRHDARLAVFAAQEAVRKAKTKADARDAARAVIKALEDEAGALQELGTQNKLTMKDVDKFEKDVKSSYAAIGRRVPAELQKIIDKMRVVANFDADINVSVNSSPARGPARKKRAMGGPVVAGEVYQVNERDDEFFRPNVNGTILKNQAAIPLGTTAAGKTWQINITNPEPRAADDDIGRVMRRLESLGI